MGRFFVGGEDSARRGFRRLSRWGRRGLGRPLTLRYFPLSFPGRIPLHRLFLRSALLGRLVLSTLPLQWLPRYDFLGEVLLLSPEDGPPERSKTYFAE